MTDTGLPTRRSILKNSAIGASVSIFSQTARADADTVKLPKAYGRDGVKEYHVVPERWWNHYKNAKTANKNILREYSDSDYVESSGIIAHNETYGGKRGFQIEVEISSGYDPSVLPDRVDNIPVKITQKQELNFGCGCGNTPNTCGANNCYYGDLPGGVPVESWTGGGKSGTICCWVKKNNERAVLTSGHLFYDEDMCNSPQDNGYSPRTGSQFKIGPLFDFNRNVDYALVESSGNHDVSNHIMNENQKSWQVEGVFSESAISDLVSSNGVCGDNERRVYQMGITTGQTPGCITKLDHQETGSCGSDFDGKLFKTTYKSGEGDSGGPIFVDNGDWTYIVGMNVGYGQKDGTMCGGSEYSNDLSFGMPAHHLRNQYDMTFDLNAFKDPWCVGDCIC